jgi:hypothetical protein
MARRLPPKFVWFLLGISIFALAVALYLPAFPLNGINNTAIAHLFLWIALGTCGTTLLELAIIYFPGLTGPQSALLLLLFVLTCLVGWAGRTRVFDWIDENGPQQGTKEIIAHVLPGNFGPEPQAAPHASLDLHQDSSSLPAIQTNSPLQMRPAQNENREPANPKRATATPIQQPCIVGPGSNSDTSPDCAPPKLPTISVTQRNLIRDAMKPYAGLKFTILRENPTDDSRQYAAQIERALVDAGLNSVGDQDTIRNGISDPAGVSLIVGNKESDAATRMSSAMRRAGLIPISLPISRTSEPEGFQVIVTPLH